MKLSHFLLFVCASVLCSCRKDNSPAGTASLTIVNAVVGSNPLITNFSGTNSIIYSNAQSLNYGSYSSGSNEFGGYSGNVRLGLFQYPDTTAGSMPLFLLNLNMPVSSMHSLYLIGTTSAPDTTWTTDLPPLHLDSSVGVRFVNLSPGSNPVNVVLSTGMANEFSSLAYKKVTAFKSYPAVSSISSYTFQFIDAPTNAVLASYTMRGINNGTGSNRSTNQYRYKNVTIALIGLPAGTGSNAQKVLQINNW